MLVKAIPKWTEPERRVKIRLSIWSRDYRLKSLPKWHARSYAAALVIKRFAIKAVYKYQTLPRYGEGAPWKMYIGSCWTEERRGSSRAVPRTTRGMRQYRFSVSARRRRTSVRQETLLEAISISHLVARNLCPSRRPCHPRDLNWIAVGARRADERELISRLISENTLKRPRCVRENVGRRMRRAVVRARGNNPLHSFRARGTSYARKALAASRLTDNLCRKITLPPIVDCIGLYRINQWY